MGKRSNCTIAIRKTAIRAESERQGPGAKEPGPRALGLAGKSGDGEDGHIGEFEGQTGIGASAGVAGIVIAVGPVQAEIVAEAIDVAVRA